MTVSLAGKYRNAMRRCQLLLDHKVDSLLALLCPFRCVLCDAPARGMDLCDGCRADLPWLSRACRQCALPLVSGNLCGRCALQPPRSSVCFAALIYEYPVNRMIAALKFSHRPAIARIAGELLAGYLRTRCSTVVAEPELLVPVPLHPLRWRERGYNQAELIAATVADRLRLHCSADVLRRDRNTAAQTRFGRERRQRNLRAAFSVQKNVSGLRIALVDDVITTGATAAACVGELLHAGAADVQVWAVARTITGFQKYS